MLKTFQKNVELPLPGRIRVQGLRSETSLHPEGILLEQTLQIRDTWKIQLAYILSEQKQFPGKPAFLEQEIRWEAEIPWSDKLPFPVILSYRKKPYAQRSHIIAPAGGSPLLSLTLEAVLDIDYPAPAPEEPEEPDQSARPEEPARPAQPEQPAILSASDSQPSHITPASFQEATLESRIKALEEQLSALQTPPSTLFGSIIDAFRLHPVAKAEIELVPELTSGPAYKTLSNSYGFYAFGSIKPGVYNITVRHPRFLPLAIKGYAVKENSDKKQDLLLRSI
jgi:hypothetical protein